MKQIINRFSYANLRNEVHVQLHENFIALVAKHKVEELGIKAIYDPYVRLFDDEKSALDRIIKSDLTDEILALDAKRDQLFRGFVDAVKSGLNHYDATKVAGAERINFILARYGNIAARPLDQETAAINDLIRELQESPTSEQALALGVGEWVKYLFEANEEFEELMRLRYSETAKRPTINMRQTRGSVDKLFRAMLDLLEALIMVNGNEDFKTFIAELNAVMQRYENILASQKGRNAKEETNKE
ncbi:MAG: DUF6261 family protein [Bacteroidales bacterium]|jgi:hypothetical protein|nr:DUF6261 family protein [Bacteroidales bacterium]